MNSKLSDACIAIAVILASSMAAHAADLTRPDYKAPAYVGPAAGWAGWYVGLNAGYGFGSANWTTPPPSKFNTTGYVVGGTLGYNYQFGSIVLGGEGDIDFSTVKGNDGNAVCAGPGGGCNTKMKYIGTARVRVGYAFDRFLPYLTAGLAYANFENSDFNSETKSKLGWTGGIGLEYAFLGAWSAKIEYLYASFGTMTCATCTVPSQDIDYKVNLIRLGVNYRF
ncbi:MAG: outer membrane protein [Pseudolabrys sp.]